MTQAKKFKSLKAFTDSSFVERNKFFLVIFALLCSCYMPPYVPPAGKTNLPLIPPNSISTNQLNSTGSANPANQLGPPNTPQGPNAPQSNADARTRTNELAYDLTPDFITTLTCDHNVNLRNGYYTLSVGSYYEGLKLSEAFKRVNGLNTKSTQDAVQFAINSSPLKTARAEISVRDSSNFYAQAVSNGQPIKGFFPVFNTNYILDQLTDLRNKSILFSRPVENTRYNSAPFRVQFQISNSSFVRDIGPSLDHSSGNKTLNLFYTNPQSQLPILNTNRQPYGKSYTLAFNSNLNMDYLTNVYERDLQEQSRGQGWTCPPDLKFMIHKNENQSSSQYNKDAANKYKYLGLEEIGLEGYCDINARNSLTQRQKDFLALEFGEQERSWPFKVGSTVISRNERYINTGEPCLIIPAGRGSCYSNSGFYRVEFDTERLNSCKRIYDLTASDKDYNNVQGAAVYRICPAWLSMCYRNEN